MAVGMALVRLHWPMIRVSSSTVNRLFCLSVRHYI